MNISGPAAVAKPEMLFYAPGDLTVTIALAAGGGFYAFAKQKQKKQAEKEALDPDAGYTEDKGDFEIPTEDEPEDTGEEDTEPI